MVPRGQAPRKNASIAEAGPVGREADIEWPFNGELPASDVDQAAGRLSKIQPQAALPSGAAPGRRQERAERKREHPRGGPLGRSWSRIA
jgi:hypothetical protein